MARHTRCPTCRAHLDLARVIDEDFVQGEGGNVWRTRFACQGCLSVVDVARPESDMTGRGPSASVEIAMPGTPVARLLARLREVQDPIALREETERLLASRERWLARVPEVFSAIRGVFRGSVRLREHAWFLSCSPVTPILITPRGRIVLRELSDRTADGIEEVSNLLAGVRRFAGEAVVRAGSVFATPRGQVVLPAGTLLEVRSLECPLVLSLASLPPSGVPVDLSDVESFVAAPDLLAPTAESP